MDQNLVIDELIGNSSLKTQLKIAFGAAKIHNRPIGHVLFTGQAGCGKTSFSQALAKMGRSYFVQVAPESLKTSEDIAEVFAKFPDTGYDLETGSIIGTINPSILFIDEIHQLSLKAEEMLGIAMENYIHNYSRGKGKKKSIVPTWVPKFTLIGATTREGELSKPFRDRFKHTFIFSAYSEEESCQIINLHAAKSKVTISQDAVLAIAKRSRGTPRLMVRYLERMIDGMLVLGEKSINEMMVEAQFGLLEIDQIGLTKADVEILRILHESDAAVGLETLAIRTNQDTSTVSEVSEPYLMRLGFLERGPRGRTLTERGLAHLIKLGIATVQPISRTRRIINDNGGING